MSSDWINVNIPFGPADGAADSLYRRGLIKSGTQVRIQNGGTYLIGDINLCGGECDCCARVNRNDIVDAYRVLIEEGT